MDSFLLALGGAVCALVLEHIYLFIKDKRNENRQKFITFPNPSRVIGKDIFERLGPGGSVELMKSVLGTPDKTFTDEIPVFEEYREEESGLIAYEFETEEAKRNYEENKFKTTAYYYDFKNAVVKLTSKSREVIDSLAVDVKDGHKLDASGLPLGFVTASGEEETALILGESKVDRELAESSRLEYLFSRYDNLFVCSIYTAAPLYTHYTYFGVPVGDNDPDKNNPLSFVGHQITGVCLHRDEYECYVPRAWDNL